MIKNLWLLLSLGCIGWYLVIFGFVVVKGGADIKEMLKKLSVGASADEAEDEKV